MKKVKILVILSLCFVFSAQAQDAQQADHAQLKKILGQVEDAINANNIAMLSSHLHDDVVITFLNAEVVRGIPAVKDYYNRMLGTNNALLSSYQTTAKESQPAQIIANVALADGRSQDVITFKNGSVMNMDTIWSTALLKNEGVWKIKNLHFSTNVFENPILSAAEKSIAIFSVVAVFFGLIIGFFMGRKKSN